MAKQKKKPLIRLNSMWSWGPSRCDGKIPPFSALILQTKVIGTKWCQNRTNSMHFTHRTLNRLERGWNVRILTNTYRWNQTRFIEGIQLNFTCTAKQKSKPLFQLNAMGFWEPSRCDGKIPPFSAQILQIKSIRTNDVKTGLIRCISHIQCWNVWNEVETFEYSRNHIVETKKGLSSEYQSNFTPISKRTSNPLVRPNSMCF
jgi:hypothetical protein